MTLLRRLRAFTLIEVLIVIVMIGILIAMTLPSYRSYVRRAHYLSVVSAASPYKLAVTECYALLGSLQDCQSGRNGIPAVWENDTPDGAVHDIRVDPLGKIIVTPNAHRGIEQEDQFILVPTATKVGLIWHTRGKGVEKGYAN